MDTVRVMSLFPSREFLPITQVVAVGGRQVKVVAATEATFTSRISPSHRLES